MIVTCIQNERKAANPNGKAFNTNNFETNGN